MNECDIAFELYRIVMSNPSDTNHQSMESVLESYDICKFSHTFPMEKTFNLNFFAVMCLWSFCDKAMPMCSIIICIMHIFANLHTYSVSTYYKQLTISSRLTIVSRKAKKKQAVRDE